MTLLETVYDRTRSLRKAAQVHTFILAWGQTANRLGREPSIEEYAADWKQSRATAFREQQRFRVAFPEHENPGPLLREYSIEHEALA